MGIITSKYFGIHDVGLPSTSLLACFLLRRGLAQGKGQGQRQIPRLAPTDRFNPKILNYSRCVYYILSRYDHNGFSDTMMASSGGVSSGYIACGLWTVHQDPLHSRPF